jgi:hypothetical protein
VHRYNQLSQMATSGLYTLSTHNQTIPYTSLWSPDARRLIVADESGQLGIIDTPTHASQDQETVLHGINKTS